MKTEKALDLINVLEEYNPILLRLNIYLECQHKDPVLAGLYLYNYNVTPAMLKDRLPDVEEEIGSALKYTLRGESSQPDITGLRTELFYQKELESMGYPRLNDFVDNYDDYEDAEEDDDDEDYESEIELTKETPKSDKFYMDEITRLYSLSSGKVCSTIYNKFIGFFNGSMNTANWQKMLPIIIKSNTSWKGKMYNEIKHLDKENRKTKSTRYNVDNCNIIRLDAQMQKGWTSKSKINVMPDTLYTYVARREGQIVPVDPTTGNNSKYNLYTTTSEVSALNRLCFMSRRFKDTSFGIAKFESKE